jgi:uncharacterized DUF497 family protein
VRFEWDETKNRANQKKHGVSFHEAALVFDDDCVMFRKDRTVEGEQRWHAIGAVEKAVLVVVHTCLTVENDKEEIVRIISARAANKRERRVYLQQATE